jgi:uncharacterized protein YecE (DUF72 family)
MAKKTGESFLFSIRANQEMTNRTDGNEPVFGAFLEAIEPIIEMGRLGCVLAQFPPAFQLNRQNWDYLKVLKQRLHTVQVVVEFRNGQWLRDEVFGWLRNLGLGFCCVDETLAPDRQPHAEATGQVSYVRLPGRVRAGKGPVNAKPDSTYSKPELAQWVPRIRKLESMSDKTFVYAGNHTRAQAISNVRQLRGMLA